MTAAVQQANEDLHQAMYKTREKRFRDAGLDFEGFRSQVLHKAHVAAEDLHRIGFLDGIGNQWSVKEETAGDTREWVAMFPPHRSMGSAHYKRGNNFEYLINNRFLVF